jgi:hypothetical protein
VPSNYSSLTVTWYDQTDAYATSAAITADVKSIPMFTDTGTGEVNQATIIVRSLDGRYVTTGSNKFAEFDRIRIQCTDLANNSYDRYFEILSITPSQSKGQGTLVTLNCLGIEYHTQQIHMAKPYWFEDSYTVALSVAEFYERNRGTEQPALSNYNVIWSEVAGKGGTGAQLGYGNGLPFYNANNWDFGVNEDSCYNRWMDLVDGAGAAVEAGGALTFFELNFLTTGVNAMNFKLRPSGDNSTNIVTVKNSVVQGVKVGEQDGQLSNPTGSNVLAWGSNEHGSLPVDHSKYYSGLMQFVFRPEWKTGTVYAVGAKVKVTPTTTVKASHYVCATAHTSGTFATDLSAGKWTQIDMNSATPDGFGNDIQYSPWTDDKAEVWGNSGANPARNTFSSGGWADINLVINESDWFRTWADAAITGTNVDTDTVTGGLDDLAARYAYNGNKATFPRGFRVLLADTGTPTGTLANFNNTVAEVVALNSTGTLGWAIKYSFGLANNKVQVAVLDEAVIYEDTITGTVASPSHSWAAIPSKTIAAWATSTAYVLNEYVSNSSKYYRCIVAHTSDSSSFATDDALGYWLEVTNNISTSNEYGNDCFHPYTVAPANDKGTDGVYDILANAVLPRSDVTDSTNYPNITSNGDRFTKNLNSAVRLISESADIVKVFDDLTWLSQVQGSTTDYFKSGIGATIRFPYPTTTDNSITEGVGQLYGGGATGADKVGGSGNEDWATSTAYKVADIVFESNLTYICLVAHTSGTFATDKSAGKWRQLHGKEPSTLDIQNMNFTHDGQNGFNAVGGASEDLGQISAVAFWLKYSKVSSLPSSTHKTYDHYFENGTDMATMYSGSTTRCGVEILASSPAIDTRVKYVRFSAKKTGSPTGNITIAVRDNSDTVVESTTLDSAILTTSYADYEVAMPVAELKQDYRVSIEYSGGSASNNVKIESRTVTTETGYGFFTYNGSYTDATTQMPAITFDSRPTGELNDEHRFRAWAIDTNDNVVYQDFVVRFSNNWEDIRLPIGGFRAYKGRKPLYGSTVVVGNVVPPKELEIINVFEWRNVKIFGIQEQGQYDQYGRYNPASAVVSTDDNTTQWDTIFGSRKVLWIDGFRFVKPLLATSGVITDRELEPDFLQLPNIEIYDQLVNAAKSQLEIEKFKHKEFMIDSTGDEIFDILFGESFYLDNSELVDDSDNGANNIKLVAKRIEYSITKPPSGAGGLRRRIQGSKVFT